MNDERRYEGKIIDKRYVDLPSLKQAIHSEKCDVETVRWAVNWWQTAWGGIDTDTLEYLGIGEE